MATIHLAECEPEEHPGWLKTTAYEAWNTHHAQHCPQTAYMAEELFSAEEVWVETGGEDRDG